MNENRLNYIQSGTTVLATERHIPGILHLVSLLPLRPHETEGSIRRMIEETDDIVTVGHLCAVRLLPDPTETKFRVIWWLWSGNDRRAWQQCLLFTLEEVLRQYGPSANSWDGSGDFGGEGPPGQERTRYAQEVARRALPMLPATDGHVSGKLAMGIQVITAALAQ